MLLTIATTGGPTANGAEDPDLPAAMTTSWPATDLGYLLHKNPARVQAFEVASGTAHVFYPEATTGPVHRRPAAGGRPGGPCPRSTRT